MSILDKILMKRGIKDVSELSEEERGTFENWKAVLSEENVTVEKIKEFCLLQIGMVEAQFKNLDNTAEKNGRLILLHSVYSSILGAIDGPAEQRKALEKHLTTLL